MSEIRKRRYMMKIRQLNHDRLVAFKCNSKLWMDFYTKFGRKSHEMIRAFLEEKLKEGDMEDGSN
jgi:hypothetical protein